VPPFIFGSGTDLIQLFILLLLLLFFFFFFLLGRLLQKSLRLRRFKLDRGEILQDCSSSECALIERVRFFLQRYTFKVAAMSSHHAEKCSHLVTAHAPSARHICISVRQILVHVTFALVMVSLVEVDLKIALLTFKSITTHRPTYLFNLLQFRTTSCYLHSCDQNLLYDAGVRTVFGSRMFCHAALTICNSLPADLTDNFNNMLLSGFKCSLKTYFYKLSFAT